VSQERVTGKMETDAEELYVRVSRGLPQPDVVK
jgi:hypothetical protein